MKAVGLKVQITVLVMLLIAGVVTAVSWTRATQERRLMLTEMQQRVLIQARHISLISAKPLLHADPEFELHPLITSVMRTDHNIASIIVTDSRGIIRGHFDVMMIDRPYKRLPDLEKVAAPSFLAEDDEITENYRLFQISVPVTDHGECIGTIHLQYSKGEIQQAVDRMNLRIMRIGFISILFGALISILLALHITRPVSILTKSVAAIGEGRLDTRIKIGSVREIETLAGTFNEMVKRLEEDQKALVDKKRMEKELEIAHEIQETLLPSTLPHLRNYEMDVYYHPASQVGGDYFDLIPLDDRHMYIVVGDVAGKGVPGLVVMAMVRVIVRALALQRENPEKLLRRLNSLLKKDMRKNLFVTLFCGLLDATDGTLVFASAAHMPLLVYHGRDRLVQMLQTKAKPLGLFEDGVFSRDLEEKTIKLMPGDLFMQYTDGLTEMKNSDGEEYGLERMMQLAVDEAAGGARHFLGKIQEQLKSFRGNEPQSDDLTLLTVNALPEGMERASADRMELLDRVVFD
jgi:serine phosphatase RsbU (regulator of sigma subunit)